MSLNEHQERIRDGHVKRLVSNSRAIISNQVAIPLGVIKMRNIISSINDLEPIENIDFTVFSAYVSRIGNLPIGTERLAYNLDFLKQQDIQLDYLTAFYKDRIIDTCFEIINKLVR